MRYTLDELNAMPAPEFVAALGGIFEHSPWIAGRAAGRRPFSSAEALFDAMQAALRAALEKEQLGLIRAHPDLGRRLARAGLTAASQAEQGSLGLDRLDGATYARFVALNDAYRGKFGFPFVICVRLQTRDSVLAAFEQRLRNDSVQELGAALAEIALIARLRLADLVAGLDAPSAKVPAPR